MRDRLDLEYVLPLRWGPATSAREEPGMTAYLARLAALADVTVVDGSADDVFAHHHELWSPVVRHVRPEGCLGPNGKVAGVVTGVFGARHERVVVADDDVRYDEVALRQLYVAQASADVVRPQCVFEELVWHTRWDTARMLVNRAFGHDFPGTHGLRRSTFVAAGGYDGAALFENLEMTRTITAAGGVVLDAPWLAVRRLAPATGQFWDQRVRQAYDDFAQPARLAVELTLLPAIGLTACRRPAVLAVWAALSVAVAEVGRRRAGGARFFQRTAALWAPVWVCERAVCVWLAVFHRWSGGARYGGRRLPLAAHSTRELRAVRRGTIAERIWTRGGPGCDGGAGRGGMKPPSRMRYSSGTPGRPGYLFEQVRLRAGTILRGHGQVAQLVRASD